MTAHAEHAGVAGLSIRNAGRVCRVVSLLGAASGIYLAFVEPMVDQGQWSYPLDAGGFSVIQTFFFLQHLGLVLGLVALWLSGAVGQSRLGRYGHYGAVAGMAGLTLTELAAISAASDSTDSSRVGVLGGMYGVTTILIGVALVLEGIAVIRAKVWKGWKRWVPLTLGAWVFVPMLPALALSFTGARFAIAGWMLLFAALGWALVKHADDE